MNAIPSIEPLLESFCDKKISEAHQINPRYGDLWLEIKQYLLAGGKRMRPRLTMMAYDAYGEKSQEDIVAVAAAWELLHACVLVHDDIIDRDLIRHGHPNIAGKYQSIYASLGSPDANHYALSAALISGDLLLMSAYELIANSPIDNNKKLIAQSYITKAIFVVAGGELIDTDSVLYPVDQSDPRSVMEYKTASYSLQLPLQCGAALAGASPKELDKLSEIGLHAGIAFQLRDDLLGVYGDSAETGKSNRSDILEKKRTALILETIDRLNPEQSARLQNLLAPDTIIDEATAEEIVELITKSGAKDVVQQLIINESATALSVVDKLMVDEGHKQSFSSLISKLTTRTH